MARVRSFSPSNQNVKAHPTEVDCEYKTILDEHGRQLLHLSTFGSDDREAERKSSQSMQIDSVRAGELIAIVEKAFPEISGRRSAGGHATPFAGSPWSEAVTSTLSTEGDMEAALVDTAAKVVADQLRANFQGERWAAVLIRTAALMEGLQPDR